MLDHATVSVVVPSLHIRLLASQHLVRTLRLELVRRLTVVDLDLVQWTCYVVKHLVGAGVIEVHPWSETGQT